MLWRMQRNYAEDRLISEAGSIPTLAALKVGTKSVTSSDQDLSDWLSNARGLARMGVSSLVLYPDLERDQLLNLRYRPRRMPDANQNYDFSLEIHAQSLAERTQFLRTHHNLSPREIATLVNFAFIVEIEDVARRMFISSATVRSHMRNVFSKLDITSRAALMKFAYERLS